MKSRAAAAMAAAAPSACSHPAGIRRGRLRPEGDHNAGRCLNWRCVGQILDVDPGCLDLAIGGAIGRRGLQPLAIGQPVGLGRIVVLQANKPRQSLLARICVSSGHRIPDVAIDTTSFRNRFAGDNLVTVTASPWRPGAARRRSCAFRRRFATFPAAMRSRHAPGPRICAIEKPSGFVRAGLLGRL